MSLQVVAQCVLCDQPPGDGFLQGSEERQSGHSLPQRDPHQPEGRRLRGGAGLQEEEARLQAEVSFRPDKQVFIYTGAVRNTSQTALSKTLQFLHLKKEPDGRQRAQFELPANVCVHLRRLTDGNEYLFQAKDDVSIKTQYFSLSVWCVVQF